VQRSTPGSTTGGIINRVIMGKAAKEEDQSQVGCCCRKKEKRKKRMMGVGIVARDQEGKVMAWMCTIKPHIFYPVCDGLKGGKI
jgi:hypothetical protein